MFNKTIFLLFLLIISFDFTDSRKYTLTRPDYMKDSCGIFGKLKARLCTPNIIENMWLNFKYLFATEAAKDLKFEDLKTVCQENIDCMNRTDCYKEFHLYDTLDDCVNSRFFTGPYASCKTELYRKNKKEPQNVPKCLATYLDSMNATDCETLKSNAACVLPEIKKYCDPRILKLFEQNHDYRMYNRRCDGRLKVKDE
ncbi:unnamed protein product [Caenorhabditis angaria]|uniref:T20D4.11-like domain-containing protein n=1 Tax=Caenorhabditis angaria TaxID=860376 RepID=A0A9P1IXA7_9PELO|nr:unnamed protein product [Caenorhabditis angaria]